MDQIREHAERLVDVGVGFGAVDLVEVDPICLGVGAALLSISFTIQRRELPNSFGSSPIRPWTLVASTTLSRLPPAERLADDLLGLAARVDVGGVDEVDPGVERAVDDPDAVVVIWVAPVAEHHRAEAERADLGPCVSQRAVVHPFTVLTGRAGASRRPRATFTR